MLPHDDHGLGMPQAVKCIRWGAIAACATRSCSQPHSHLTPQEVKGAAWGAIAACVSGPEAAAAAWERLTQEMVLAAPGTQQALTVAIPSYDMTYQLNEIEVLASMLSFCCGCSSRQPNAHEAPSGNAITQMEMHLRELVHHRHTVTGREVCSLQTARCQSNP
jgi:hypothetical protein